jgi:acetyltransferase-like isoleucine patch superfamily enzyme
MNARRRRLGHAVRSVLDLRSYLHAFRLVHYYGYTHVQQRRRMLVGPGSRLAPNVSITNGERVSIGSNSQIGAHCSLWAGDTRGRISIGSDVSLAPEVFITAANYRFEEGQPFRRQPMDERDVIVGDDVWLGVRVVVTAGVTIGDGCVVGAGAVVTRDLPPNTIAAGVPARPIGKRQPATATHHKL